MMVPGNLFNHVCYSQRILNAVTPLPLNTVLVLISYKASSSEPYHLPLPPSHHLTQAPWQL